jgi:hypothetical protein
LEQPRKRIRLIFLMIRRENKMKLIMKRDQRDEKGAFGRDKGVTFILTSRVELDHREQELVSKY